MPLLLHRALLSATPQLNWEKQKTIADAHQPFLVNLSVMLLFIALILIYTKKYYA